jgi:hypothetical protein
MQYTDEELKHWWRGLTRSDQVELLDEIDEKSNSDAIRISAGRLRARPNDPSAKDLILVRRWWHR